MKRFNFIFLIIILISCITILLLNNWGNDPMFNFGPNLSWNQGNYTQNNLTNYEQNYYNGFFYGIYFWIFKIKNLGFIAYKFFQFFQISLIVLIIWKIQKSKINLLYFTTLVFSNTILSGPRLEVLPMTLILLIVYFLEEFKITNTILSVSVVSMSLSILPMLHPMAIIQAVLLLSWYFFNDKNIRNYLYVNVAISIVIFLVLNNFNLHRYLEPYISGHSSKELDSHSWQPLSTLKFFLFSPLIVVGLLNIKIKSRQFLFILISLFIAQLFGRSYYGIYSVVWIVLFSKNLDICDFSIKKFIKLIILCWALILSLIRPLQALENPHYFKTNYAIAKQAHRVVEHYKLRWPKSNIWSSYVILPYLYDIDNLRFYWNMTSKLNGYGFIKKGDLFILTDNNDRLIVEDLIKQQGLEFGEMPTVNIWSSGILRTNLNRTDSIYLKIYKAE
jgi:hypothetical protein